ncbi:MAG: hypothetical protein IJ830_06315 [Alphaproteobacteria bacterium]|nr:hypothetical protein [Alphaproteobacteria bacterium]
MNFPEYDCDNEEIQEFLSHLPITTVDDYPWMNKFITDLLYHYKKGEYELSIISTHLIYMYILYCYMLKKHEFNLINIQNDFMGKKEKIPENISPFVYSIKHEKGIFLKPLLDIEGCIGIHNNVVDIRNDVAHASGNHKKQNDFINYINMCLHNIAQTKDIIWNNFKQSTKFNNEIENMVDWNDVISIFLISRREFEDLFKEKYNDVIKEKLSDISIWKNLLLQKLPDGVTVNTFKIKVKNIKIDKMDVQDDDVFCFASANIEFYFKVMKGNNLYKEQTHLHKNYPFTFEYILTTNESFFEISEGLLIED